MRALISTVSIFGGLAAGVALAFLFVDPLNIALEEVLAYQSVNEQIDEILVAGVVSAVDMQTHALVLERPDPLSSGAVMRMRIGFGEVPVTISGSYPDSRLTVEKVEEGLVGARVRIYITNHEGVLTATAIARTLQ